ncbi:MAG: cohesin domain-containing protein [Anaerolineaceae bacterium]
MIVNRNWIRVFVCCMLVLMAAASVRPAFGQAGSAQVGVFQAYEGKPGTRLEIPVEIKNVENCYAFDLELHYDPQILSVEDADPLRDGVQPALGTFLDAGMVLYNTEDAENGVIHFVMSQINPSEPKSGSGVLLVLYVNGLMEGESALELTKADLATREGQLIPAELVSGSVKISANAVQSAGTAVPVQDPTGIMMIETLMPTSTPTPVPTKAPATPTSAQAAAPVEENQPPQTGAVEQNGSEAQNSGTSVYVWGLAAALVIAGGVGLIARRVKKSKELTKEEE